MIARQHLLFYLKMNAETSSYKVTVFTRYRPKTSSLPTSDCLVTNEALRIYKDDKKASLAFESPISSIQEYSFHTDTFTLVTTAGNFGLVLDDSVKDSAKFIGTMQSRGVAENRRLPEFKAKDAGPYSFP